MKTVLLIVAVILIVCLVGIVLYGGSLFRKMIYRRPYRKAPAREEAEEPVHLSPMWEPYREAFQEGKRYFCLSDKERIEITAYDGITLVGHLLWPDGVRTGDEVDLSKIKGFLVLMHGFHGYPSNDFGLVIPYYMSLGYALMMPDERAHGESGGNYITFGIRERHDCQKWCEYLNQRFGEEKPIFLDGISMGASTVLMTSSLPLPKNVRGIIADCGFTSPKAIMKHVLKNGMHLPVFPVLLLAAVLCRCMAGFGLEEYSAVEAMKENKLPVLFIHGLADDFVPSYMTEENYAACTAPKKVMYVEGAGHGLSYLYEKEKCQAYLKEFLETYSNTAEEKIV